MRKIIWPGFAILLVFVFFLAFQRKNAITKHSSSGNAVKSINVGGERFEAEVVSTGEKIALGLSGRDSICENCGMLFVFGQEDYHRFWMKDMKFDLDMLWIKGNEVVYIARNIPHQKGTEEVVAPENKADKILELNAGTSDRRGLAVGDRIEF